MADHSILSFEKWLAVQPGALDPKEQRKRYDHYVAIQKVAQKKDAQKQAEVAALKQKQMAEAKNGTLPGATKPNPSPTQPGYLTPELQGQLSAAGIDTSKLFSGAQNTIYVGTHTVSVTPQKSRSRDPDIAGHNTIIQTEDRRPKQSVYDDYLSWTVEQRNHFIGLGMKYGLIPNGSGFIEGQKLWQTLVDQAADFQRAHPGLRMGPSDVLALMARSANGGTDSTKGPGTVTSKSTSSQVTQYDRTATESMAKQVLQAALGRDPSPAEISRYQAAINANEKAHPTVTTSTSEIGPDGIVHVSNSHTTSNTTAPSQLILDKAQATPEYGSVQAATTYFNALEQAIQAPV